MLGLCVMQFRSHYRPWTVPNLSAKSGAPVQAVNGGKATYFGAEVPFDLTTITAVEVVGMAIAEGKRAEADWNGRVYPGFDPVGMAKDPAAFNEMKLKEIKNGR